MPEQRDDTETSYFCSFLTKRGTERIPKKKALKFHSAWPLFSPDIYNTGHKINGPLTFILNRSLVLERDGRIKRAREEGEKKEKRARREGEKRAREEGEKREEGGRKES